MLTLSYHIVISHAQEELSVSITYKIHLFRESEWVSVRIWNLEFRKRNIVHKGAGFDLWDQEYTYVLDMCLFPKKGYSYI